MVPAEARQEHRARAPHAQTSAAMKTRKSGLTGRRIGVKHRSELAVDSTGHIVVDISAGGLDLSRDVGTLPGQESGPHVLSHLWWVGSGRIGKTLDSGSRGRRFESCLPSQCILCRLFVRFRGPSARAKYMNSRMRLRMARQAFLSDGMNRIRRPRGEKVVTSARTRQARRHRFML